MFLIYDKRLIFAALAFVALAFATAAGDPSVRLAPKLAKGETLRYQIETRTSVTGQTTTPIANPEGASSFDQTVNLVVRLDVLDAGGAKGGIRLRATYDRSDSESRSDSFSPQIQSLDARYKSLQGRSIEFTLSPSGQLTNFTGLEDIFPNRSEADSILSWARSVSSGEGFPQRGIRIGQKWRRESPLAGSPIEGLLWQTESSYLRNDPCDDSLPGPGDRPGPPSKTNECAVVLTRFDILRHGSPTGDATPEDYRRNGLRTSGRWTGSGESLDSISLSTGLLMRSTQTSTQDMDYRITSAITGSAIHRTGRVDGQTEITLMPSK